MNKEIKYTSDGKKVVVVGKLNAQETIVQEIFIQSGNEIPSGENFVVKSLHDSPSESWKQRELRKIEERYESESKSWKGKIDKLNKSCRSKSDELKARLQYIGLALKNADEEVFELLTDFLTGRITHVVSDSYEPDIYPIDDFHKIYGDQALQLVSIFGKYDGTLSYYRGSYSDNSGYSKTHFTPCRSYKEAVELYKEIVLSKGPSDKRIEIAAKHGVSFPEVQLAEYYQRKVDDFKNKIEVKGKEIEKCEEEMMRLESIIDGLKS